MHTYVHTTTLPPTQAISHPPIYISSHSSSHGLPNQPPFHQPTHSPLHPSTMHPPTHLILNVLTHSASHLPPTCPPTHTNTYLATRTSPPPIHLSSLYPGIYPSPRVNIWVPIQHQRQPCSPRKPQTHHTQLQKEQGFFLEVSML